MNNDLDLFTDFSSLNAFIDKYLGVKPTFSLLGDQFNQFQIKCSYKGFGAEETLIISRDDVDLVVRYYMKEIEKKTLNEQDFYRYLTSKGFNKTKCFYFYDRLLSYGGYDGKKGII